MKYRDTESTTGFCLLGLRFVRGLGFDVLDKPDPSSSRLFFRFLGFGAGVTTTVGLSAPGRSRFGALTRVGCTLPERNPSTRRSISAIRLEIFVNAVLPAGVPGVCVVRALYAATVLVRTLGPFVLFSHLSNSVFVASNDRPGP